MNKGISFLQSFDIVVHPRCTRTIEELRTYRFKIDPKDDRIVLHDFEDKHNHIIDSLRYSVEEIRHKRQRRAGGGAAGIHRPESF